MKLKPATNWKLLELSYLATVITGVFGRVKVRLEDFRTLY